MYIKRDITESFAPYIPDRHDEGSIAYILAPVMLAVIFKVVLVIALTATF